MGLEDWAMKENDGFGFRIWGVAEVVDVAGGTEAADDDGAVLCTFNLLSLDQHQTTPTQPCRPSEAS